MIKQIIVIFLLLTNSLFSQGTNALILKSRDLKYNIFVAKTEKISQTPDFVVSTTGKDGLVNSRGFYKIRIRIEEILYSYNYRIPFSLTLPNLAKGTKEILVGSNSNDPHKWIGIQVGETGIFFVGPLCLDVARGEICIGIIDISNKKVLMQTINDAIADQMRYSKGWQRWACDVDSPD